MTKKILFLIVFILSGAVFSQNKTVTIKWKNEDSFLIESSSIAVSGAVKFEVNENNYTSKLYSKWKPTVRPYAKAIAVDISYEEVSERLTRQLDLSQLKSSPEIKVSAIKARSQAFEVLSFNPYVFVNNRVKRITSFNLKRSNVSRSRKAASANGRFSSKLASGVWKRFKIDATGVYKITPQFLIQLGINLNGINENTIKIYGFGGKALRLQNNENRFYDIPEVPTKLVNTNGNNSFSGSDYLMFYGQGTQGYDEENDTNLNPYSDEAYYYITAGGETRKSVVTMNEPSDAASTIFTAYDYEAFYERDLVNIGAIGRKWFGDKFGEQNERIYNFEIPSPELGKPIAVNFEFAGVYKVLPGLNVVLQTENGVVNQDFSFGGTFNEERLAYRSINSGASFEVPSGRNLSVKFTFDQKNDVSSEGFLDYLRVLASSNLQGIEKQFLFKNNSQLSLSGVVEYSISNAQNLSTVWDVTDQYSISEKNNNGSPTFNFKALSGEVKNYVAIDERDLYEPSIPVNPNVDNQDLKGNIFRTASESNSSGEIEYLIITRADFVSAANRLANLRRKIDGFETKVVTVEQIYNEFSAGQQDISAIRNFINYVYSNSKDLSRRLKFVCLMGDGSFDPKNRIENNTNIVPSYYSTISNDLANSFVSDDFFGMMDEDEGRDIAANLLDIAVGRVIAETPQVANQMVDKLETFYSEASLGNWRNNFVLVSDDVDAPRGSTPIDATLGLKLDFVAEQMKAKLPNANITKVHSDAFPVEISPAGARYPEAKRRFINAFEAGSSYINYFGHGNEDGTSSEAIFRINDARELTNIDKLSVFITLTCELTRFDNPLRDTTGEEMYLNERGGVVALLTTTRNLFFNTGLALNPILSEELFTQEQEAVAIGEALRISKNRLFPRFGNNKRTVFCIGDPAIKMPLPKPNIVLTKVNGKSVYDADFDTVIGSLKALDRIVLEGRVVNFNEKVVVSGSGTNRSLSIPNPVENFTGKIGISIFDKTETRQTLANDGVQACYELDNNGNELVCENGNRRFPDNLFMENGKLEFDNPGAKVFNGQASVKNGEFKMEFVLSKNIKLPIGDGKISFYAQKSKEVFDQSGFATVKIGGLNLNAEPDNTQPLIELFLDTESFLEGQLVSNQPTLIAKFSDENGINTAGGVGHDIVAIIDGDDKNPIVLNDFYTTSLDDFTKGIVNFRLRDLEPGEHTIELRASDVFNNVGFQKTTFVVGDKDEFNAFDIVNFPNPFTSYTEFWFTHSGPRSDTLDVMIQIMTITGKIVTTKRATLSGNTNRYQGVINWDARDDFGQKVGKGVYLYKIIIKSALTEKTISKIEKLVVL